MKRIVILLLLLSCTILAGRSQNAYYDAILLRDSSYMDDGKVSFYYKDSAFISGILKPYVPGAKYYSELIVAFQGNPFILLPEINSLSIGQPFDISNLKSISGAVSSLGGLDVTNIADGLAKFLVKRTKEELNVAFFSKFKETLNKPEYRDLKTLFPKTWELLDVIGDEIYDYNKYLQNLREAFQADIKKLDENFPGIIDNHEAFFNKNFELAVSLNTACYITKSLKNSVHPGDIIDRYPLKYLKMKDSNDYFNKNWSGALQTLQLFNESLRDTLNDKDNYWVSEDQVKKLVNDRIAFKIYLGLIYQVAKNERYDSIPFENGSFISVMDSIGEYFDSVNETYLDYKNFILDLAIKTDDLNMMMKNFSKPARDSIAFENYTHFFRSSVELIEYSANITELPYFNEVININLDSLLQDYFKITYEVTDLATDINRRNYSSAINHTVIVYNLVRTKVLESEISGHSVNGDGIYLNKRSIKALSEYQENLKNAFISLKLKNEDAQTITIFSEFDKSKPSESIRSSYNSSLEKLALRTGFNKDALKGLAESKTLTSFDELASHIDSILEINEARQSKDVLAKLTRYGTFIATVSTAKNSDEIAEAIESTALPSGSSRIKRETPFNVSLNAYTGLFIGFEDIVGVKDEGFLNAYGLTAPIGVALSTGNRKFLGAPCKKEGHWSYSAFFSLIDLGAVAAFRFANDTVDQVPSIQLEDIFSPGLFLSVGIPKCPLSVNMGVQCGPNLRKIYQIDDDPTTEEIEMEYLNQYENNIYWRYSISILVDIPIFNFYTKSR